MRCSRSAELAAQRRYAPTLSIHDTMEALPTTAGTTFHARVRRPQTSGLRRAPIAGRATASPGPAPMAAGRTHDLGIADSRRQQDDHKRTSCQQTAHCSFPPAIIDRRSLSPGWFSNRSKKQEVALLFDRHPQFYLAAIFPMAPDRRSIFSNFGCFCKMGSRRRAPSCARSFLVAS